MLRSSFVSAFFLYCGGLLFASTPDDLIQYAQSAILIEMDSGRVLYAHHADDPRIPASLTKIVSLTLAYEAIAKKALDYSTPITVSERASMHNMPPRSSLMYIEPGQRLTFYDLMLGLAIASGNDAAVALAETVSGDVETFVLQMNQLMQNLGATTTHFVDPAGIEESNITTAREYAQLVRYYLQHFPYALQELHQITSFSYPTLQQMNHQGTMRYTRIHNNANGLLKSYDGTDGLKTGYLDESGYNLVATAKRGDMRLIVVILGVKAPGTQTGSARREADAKNLLDYGFSHYRYYSLDEHRDFQQVYTTKLTGGIKPEVDLVLESDTKIFYPLQESEWRDSLLSWHVDALYAPVESGKEVGNISLVIDGEEQWHSALATQEKVNKLPFWLYINAIFEEKMLDIFFRR